MVGPGNFHSRKKNVYVRKKNKTKTQQQPSVQLKMIQETREYFFSQDRSLNIHVVSYGFIHINHLFYNHREYHDLLELFFLLQIGQVRLTCIAQLKVPASNGAQMPMFVLLPPCTPVCQGWEQYKMMKR